MCYKYVFRPMFVFKSVAESSTTFPWRSWKESGCVTTPIGFFFILDRAIESTAEVEWFIWFLPQKVININCFFSSLFLTLQSANVSYHGTSVWKQHDKLHFSADSRFPVFAPENKESLLSNALKIHNLSLHWKIDIWQVDTKHLQYRFISERERRKMRGQDIPPPKKRKRA